MVVVICGSSLGNNLFSLSLSQLYYAVAANSDGPFLGHQPGRSKIKSSLATNNHIDLDWKIVEEKKKSNCSTVNTNENFKSPISPNLQHIVDNRPTLV